MAVECDKYYLMISIPQFPQISEWENATQIKVWTLNVCNLFVKIFM